MSSSVSNILLVLTATVVFVNSSLGMVVCLSGATQIFPWWKNNDVLRLHSPVVSRTMCHIPFRLRPRSDVTAQRLDRFQRAWYTCSFWILLVSWSTGTNDSTELRGHMESYRPILVLEVLEGYIWPWVQIEPKIPMSRSYTLLTIDRIPRLVSGCLFNSSLQLKKSDSTHHWTPRALSIGKVSWSRSKVLTSLALSDTGIEFMTSRLLLIHFVMWKPPLSQSLCKSFTKITASFTYSTDLRQSST